MIGSSTGKRLTASLNTLRMAEFISTAIHPFFISFLSIGLLLYLDTENLGQSLIFAGLFGLIVLFPQYLLLSINVKKGRYSDKDVSNRKQRSGLYLLGIACMLGYIFIAHAILTPPVFFYILILAGVILTIIFFLITKIWTKISIHCGALATLSTFMAYYSKGLLICFIIFTLLISWSRFILSQHTVLQIVLSWMVPAIVIPLIIATLL